MLRGPHESFYAPASGQWARRAIKIELTEVFIRLMGFILIGIVIGLIIAFPAGVFYRKKVAEKEIASAEEEAKRIINESIKSAESKKREALVEAKE